MVIVELKVIFFSPAFFLRKKAALQPLWCEGIPFGSGFY